MKLLILPISGGSFVVQLAIIEKLCEVSYLPDLSLGSSGGNVTAYISAAADWKKNSIRRVAKELKQEYFARPWTNLSNLSYIVGFFQGNLYQQGIGVEAYLNRYFTSKTIQRYEIWTGTYNVNRKRVRVFSNRSKEDSILSKIFVDRNLTQSLEPVFLEGNIEKISNAGLASASIPGVIPPTKIENESYVDGGVATSSPLTLLQDSLHHYITEKEENLHMIYVSSVDISQLENVPSYNLFDTWKQATDNLLRYQTVVDRLSAYNLLAYGNREVEYCKFPCTKKNLERIFQLGVHLSRYLLEIYPTIHVEIELSDITGENILTAMDKVEGKLYCNFWWLKADFDAELEEFSRSVSN